MPASAASVVAKLATNPATAQTVPKSLRNLRPLREKKAQDRSLFHAESAKNAEHNQVTQQQRQYRKSPRNLRPLREKSTDSSPIPRKERKERRVPYISYHANLCVKKAKVPFASGIPKTN